MLLRSRLAASVLLPTLLVVLGCDSGEDETPAAGQFEADVEGSRTVSLDGMALYDVATEDGTTVTAFGLVDSDDPQDMLLFVVEGAPHTGTFSVKDEEAGGLLVVSNGKDGDLYAATDGTVTVTRASKGRIEGRFRVETVNLSDTRDIVAIEGTFGARPGDIKEARIAARRSR